MLADRTIELLLRDRVRFGLGSISTLPEVLREVGGPSARAFIVSDPGVVASGVTAAVAGFLLLKSVMKALVISSESDALTMPWTFVTSSMSVMPRLLA